MPLIGVMALEHESETGLARAVRAVGSQSEFGRLIERRQSTISEWLKKDAPLPAEYVLKVEKALEELGVTDLSRHELRPDLYPRESSDDRTPIVDVVPAR